MANQSGGCKWDLGSNQLEPGAGEVVLLTCVWGLRQKAGGGAEEGGEQCSVSLAVGGPAPPPQRPPTSVCGSHPQAESGNGFICCPVTSLVTTQEEAHAEPVRMLGAGDGACP